MVKSKVPVIIFLLALVSLLTLLNGCIREPINRDIVSSRLMSFDERNPDRDLVRSEVSSSGPGQQIGTGSSVTSSAVPLSIPACPT